MMTTCYSKPLRWHEDASLQSLQLEGTTFLTVPNSNGTRKSFVSLCAQLEASRLCIALKQVHSLGPKTQTQSTLERQLRLLDHEGIDKE
jgi:hypothetical protein